MQQPKGHLSVKSSLYAVGNAKWTTQRLVQDHMDVHYKKLLNAKPAIDTKVPKSAITSVKARDSRRRKTGSSSVSLSGSRPASAAIRSSRASSHLNDNDSTGRDEFLDELQSIFSAEEVAELNPELAEELQRRRLAPTPTWSPSTAFSFTTPASDNDAMFRTRSSLTRSGLGGAGVINKTGRHRQLVGDHIDRFADRFKDSGQFQPRVLKKTAQSWLAASKHYVPPRQIRSGSKNTNLDSPTDHPKGAYQYPDTGTNTILNQPVSHHANYSSVPVHLDSIRHPETPTKHLKFSPLGNSSIDESIEETTKASVAVDKINDPGVVRFITEVTQDILERGVFTNKAIENVLQEHYVRSKGKLNERKLQLALSSLREDFGLNTETGVEASLEKGGHSVPDEFTSTSEPRMGIAEGSLAHESTLAAPTVSIDSYPFAESTSETNHPTDDELNKTVDELISKINELDTRSVEPEPDQPVAAHLEHSAANDTINVTNDTEVNAGPTDVEASVISPVDAKPIIAKDENADYEEDFE